MSRAAKGEGSAFKSGAGYRGYVTVNGQRKYFSARTKAEAAQKKRELLNRREDGRLVAGKVSTVGEWMNHWLENVAKLKPTTYAMHRWVLDEKIAPELGRVKLDALTAERIEQWVADLNVLPSSQRRYLAPLKAALNVAFMRGHIAFNPAARVELKPQGKPSTDAYSRADRDAILMAATGYGRARWHVALKHGLRPSEALGLSWPDFDELGRKLHVRNQLLRATGSGGFYFQRATKTTAGERVIHLPKSTVDLLVEHRREQMQLMAVVGGEWIGWEYEGEPVALMFTQANGKPIGARQDTKAWRALTAAAGVADSTRYKARHTAATHMLNDSGGDVAVTAKNLGHADAGFTYRTYVHPLEERERALADAMDAPYAAPYGDRDGRDQAPSAETPAAG